MNSLWQWIVGMLVWLSADHAAVEREHPAAAAAVSVARASMEPDRPSLPRRCSDCDGKGYVMKNGSRWQCPKCKGCPDGKCER